MYRISSAVKALCSAESAASFDCFGRGTLSMGFTSSVSSITAALNIPCSTAYTFTLLAKAKRSGSPAKSALSMAAVISCIGTSPSTGKTCCSNSCV